MRNSMKIGACFLIACSLSLAACTSGGETKSCEPVPDWLLDVPKKPSAKLKPGVEKEKGMAVVTELDKYADELRLSIDSIAVHQAPCR